MHFFFFNCVSITCTCFLRRNGFVLSLVQIIFPKFGILKPEMILYISTSTLEQEEVYSNKYY